jgi:RsiW-degrading membrane proteinase PrsW (M82 family)
MVSSGEQLGILVAAAFLPPIIYMIFIRYAEKHGREPWGRIFLVFLYGAVVSVVLALLFELLFGQYFEERVYDFPDHVLPEALVLAVIAAPVIEEFTKALGVRVGRPKITEVEDGIVYGVAAGLGFSATENLFYEVAALAQHGEDAFIATAVVRSLTGSFLHATATGIVGYGMARYYLNHGSFLEVIAYYAIAVLLHAAFNLIASLELVVAVGFLIIVSFIAIRWTYNRIRTLDRSSRARGILR